MFMVVASMFASSENSRMSRDMLPDETDSMSAMLSSVATDCSIGRVTSVSTCSGLAPG